MGTTDHQSFTGVETREAAIPHKFDLRPCQFGLVAATRQLLPLGRRLTVIMNCDGIRVRPEWAYT